MADARLHLHRLAVGYELDHLWSLTMGLPDATKEPALRLLAQLLEREHVRYALIGGVAVQIHTSDPRTTLDIDLAVHSFDDVPREALLAAGFTHTGRFSHSDNWRAPGSGGQEVSTPEIVARLREVQAKVSSSGNQ